MFFLTQRTQFKYFIKNNDQHYNICILFLIEIVGYSIELRIINATILFNFISLEFSIVPKKRRKPLFRELPSCIKWVEC